GINDQFLVDLDLVLIPDRISRPVVSLEGLLPRTEELGREGPAVGSEDHTVTRRVARGPQLPPGAVEHLEIDEGTPESDPGREAMAGQVRHQDVGGQCIAAPRRRQYLYRRGLRGGDGHALRDRRVRAGDDPGKLAR